ncbi:MAG TPA: DUF2283 domain-containing protein [Streptosporangiaceae bacterium]|nr:DUF2283 domain-containing protein [Streptosporangiaceae bacterium]
MPVTVTYELAEASYIYLTDHRPRAEPGKWGGLSPGDRVESVEVETPPGVQGSVILDFWQGRLVGIEVLRPLDVLPEDFLAPLRPWAQRNPPATDAG